MRICFFIPSPISLPPTNSTCTRFINKPYRNCFVQTDYIRLQIFNLSRYLLVILMNCFSFQFSLVLFLFFNIRIILHVFYEHRGTAKSMITLLPLFGITNYVSYAEPNFDGPIWYFSSYCFTTYFLSSFQGFFISLMYCLLNTEVSELT